MINPTVFPASDIKAAFEELGVSANNVANANTDGFKSDKAVLSEEVNGGVVVKIQKTQTSGPDYLKNGELKTASNTDLTAEMAGLITDKVTTRANIKVLQTLDETEKNLIDILA